MNSLSHWAFAALELVALFLLTSPYFLWQRRKGKTWLQIVGIDAEPDRVKSFVVLLVGLVLIGAFSIWIRWRYT